MLNFGLSDEQKMLKDLAHDFAEQEIWPVAAQYDRSEEFPWPVIHKAREAGLMNGNIPEEYGGASLGLVDGCLIAEEIGWGCSGIGTSLMLNELASWPIILGGSDAQKREYLGRLAHDKQMAAYALTEPAAGSDVAGIQTTARRVGDSYELNGSKMFITNASVANFYIVFATTNPEARHAGMSAFIVEREWAGVSVGRRLEKMGQHASDTAEVVFENVKVPVENRMGPEGIGFKIAMSVFDKSRPGVASSAVGVARHATELAGRYSIERSTFGKPIATNQAISFMIADMAMNVEAGRLLALQAAWLGDNEQRNTLEAAYAKAFCADMCMKVTTDAVQVFGGYGYMREYPVEKLMRDAKVFQIYEGTSQIQRGIIARELMRKGA